MLVDLLKAGLIFLLSVCLGADDIRILQPRVAHPFPQVHYERWSYFYCHEVSAMYPLFPPFPSLFWKWEIQIQIQISDSGCKADSEFRFIFKQSGLLKSEATHQDAIQIRFQIQI